jgi:hypothetical protein
VISTFGKRRERILGAGIRGRAAECGGIASLTGRDLDSRIAANGGPPKAANRSGSAALKAASRLTAASSRVAHMTAHDASTLGEALSGSRREDGKIPLLRNRGGWQRARWFRRWRFSPGNCRTVSCTSTQSRGRDWVAAGAAPLRGDVNSSLGRWS